MRLQSKTSQSNDFVDGLLAQDAATATHNRDQLKQELKQMMVRHISHRGRVFLYGVSVAIAAAGLLFGSLIVTETLPLLAQLGLALGVCFSAAWSWKVFRLARAGEIHLRQDNRQIANMVWVFTLLMSMLMLMAAGFKEDLSDRKLILITGQALFFLVIAATYLVVQRLEEADLMARERVLRLELTLAEAEASPEHES